MRKVLRLQDLDKTVLRVSDLVPVDLKDRHVGDKFVPAVLK